MHVLSTPPAFVLSQDQTLHKRIIQNPAYINHPKRKSTKPNKQLGINRHGTLLSSQESVVHTSLRDFRPSLCATLSTLVSEALPRQIGLSALSSAIACDFCADCRTDIRHCPRLFQVGVTLGRPHRCDVDRGLHPHHARRSGHVSWLSSVRVWASLPVLSRRVGGLGATR